MSRTLFVEFRNNGFWSYDVTSSVFLMFLIDAATEKLSSGSSQWLQEALDRWRINIEVTDLGLYLEENWSQSQIDVVVMLCHQAIRNIRGQNEISAAVIETWECKNDLQICTRGHLPVPSEPVAKFGEAILDLLQETLPVPPQNHWWFYALEEEVGILEMKK